MRVRVRTLLATAIILVAGSIPAHAVATPTPVKTTKAFEWAPAAGHEGGESYLAWTQDILGRPNAPDSAFFQINGGTTRRINPRGTYGFLGDFDAGTSTLVYQQALRTASDIRLFDVSTRTFGITPAGINTAAWQWSPSIDTDEGTGTGTWYLYGENRFNGPTAPWRLILFNEAATPKKLVLDEVTNRCGCLFAGDIAYPWVVWSKGLMGNVWRYNIETQVKNKVLLPTDRDEYYASAAPDGTVYVAQAGDRCGTRARLYRVDPDGTPTLLFALPSGSEPLSINATDTGAGGTTLYSDRYFCTTKTSNIFKIDDADTATLQRGAGSVGDGVRRRATTWRAWPRSRRSCVRCEASGRCRPDLRADASA
jgi:hypothetical protein